MGPRRAPHPLDVALLLHPLWDNPSHLGFPHGDTSLGSVSTGFWGKYLFPGKTDKLPYLLGSGYPSLRTHPRQL